MNLGSVSDCVRYDPVTCYLYDTVQKNLNFFGVKIEGCESQNGPFMQKDFFYENANIIQKQLSLFPHQ